MKNVTRSVRFVLSMVLVMAMVLTSIGSFGTVAKAQTGRAADGLKGIYRIYHTEDATQRMAPGADQASEGIGTILFVALTSMVRKKSS